MPLGTIPLGAALRLRDGQIVSILVRHADRLIVRNQITGSVFECYPYGIAEVL